DDEVTVEVGAEDFLRHVAATARADSIDGGVFAGKHPEPGAGAADAPTGFVGMEDLSPPQRIDEQLIGGTSQAAQPFLGANERSRAHLEIAVGLQEVGDLAVADAEAMFHFGGHRQNDGAEGVAGGADGVRSLLGMPPLPMLSAARAPASL